ncbi:hypothetical protein HD806DRAFT_488718 [Xylariaceae sp. AK1471]|nr:hypothetical protein HD806DRAFT_488718 [Xylariaceae sp. AK1471]
MMVQYNLFFQTVVVVLVSRSFILPMSLFQEMEGTLRGIRRIEELLDAFASRDSLYPWDHLCDVVTEPTPAWKRKAPGLKGKARLIKYFRDYHNQHKDLRLLPSLDPFETPNWRDHLIVPRRFVVSKNRTVWIISGSFSHSNED